MVVTGVLGVESEVVGSADVDVKVGDSISVGDADAVVGVADGELVDTPVPRGTFCRLSAASTFEAEATVTNATIATNARAIPLKQSMALGKPIDNTTSNREFGTNGQGPNRFLAEEGAIDIKFLRGIFGK